MRRALIALLGAGALLLAALVAVALPAAAAPGTLKEAAAAKGRVFGAAAAQSHMGEAAYASTLDREFNQLTPENEMKWDTTEPSRDAFNFGPSDQLVAHAQAQGMKIRGHTLVWHNQLPGWVGGISSRDDLLSAMRGHIAKEAGHFAGKIAYWDVVNEAFQDGSGVRRDSVFQRVIGDGYIEEAFRAARAADPAAKLCYNDFNIDGRNSKSDAVYALVKDFKARGVPIDCVGLQAHLTLGNVPSDMQANMQRFADLGVDVHITELDVRMSTPADGSKLVTQANDYKKVVSACLAVSRCTVITVWGVTDKYSWVPDVFPGQGVALLFDDNYGKKAAYNASLEALGGTGPGDPGDPGDPGTVTCSYARTAQWDTGFNGQVTIKAGASAVGSWTAVLTMGSGQQISGLWNGTPSTSGNVVTVKPVGWNASLAPGASASFGFTVSAPSGNQAAPALTCSSP
ncbi:endo-1,4-beta-xylanase [Actinomadura luteofluorescens]|uniref:endo-1,4-beta-xylanase n=1 Tax=Actinomadura luteofluorescens TaxID=46163 RepID=UPI002164D4B3|nr:endo-1,4-beta-xylanase [Actinomadura glauciflava]MCR3739875.1 endo-1,4-beta-xylanase (glycosyl hydrolase family 10) (EC 3.2.1.8) [Actinomadura glauciflava]